MGFCPPSRQAEPHGPTSAQFLSGSLHPDGGQDTFPSPLTSVSVCTLGEDTRRPFNSSPGVTQLRGCKGDSRHEWLRAPLFLPGLSPSRERAGPEKQAWVEHWEYSSCDHPQVSRPCSLASGLLKELRGDLEVWGNSKEPSLFWGTAAGIQVSRGA